MAVDSATLLAIVLERLVLIALPIAAAMLLSAALGIRSTPLLLAIGLAGGGLCALLAFWVFYASPHLGRAFDWLVPIVSLGICVACLRGGRVDRELLGSLAVPLALWGLGSLFLVFLGFLHGGTAEPLQMAASRFSGQLPPDNIMPGYFADWFYRFGHHMTPPDFPGGWQASDRPPLQSGFLLLQRRFLWDQSGLRSEVVGVLLQQLWVLGLWAVLVAARIRRAGRALALIAVQLSSVAIVHGFYTWPKLLPAAFLLAAVALLLEPGWGGLRRDPRAAALIATLVSLALLGHGASVFAIAPLLVFGLYAGFPGIRWFAVAAGVGLILLAPWAAYQKYGDPPGNRLTKWMLGGDRRIDDRGTATAIVDGYENAGLGGTLADKLNNFGTIVGNREAARRVERAAELAGEGNLSRAVAEIRALFFFGLLPSLGLLILAPIAMAVARARGRPSSPEWDLSVRCWAAVVVGAVIWGLLMFGGPESNASVHVGTLAIPILAVVAAVLGLRAAAPRFALWWVGLSALLTLALYVPALTPPPATAYSAGAAVLGLCALAGFAAVLLLHGRTASATVNTLAR